MRAAENVLDLDEVIETQIKILCEAPTLKLPSADSPLVSSFVKKIEGSYDVGYIRQDTEHVVDLLSIAHAGTPEKYASIRRTVQEIINMMLDAQQAGERSVNYAIKVADTVGEKLNEVLPAWLNAKKGGGEQVKQFVTGELRTLAQYIVQVASNVQRKLGDLVKDYDRIVEVLGTTVARQESWLGNEIRSSRELMEEINAAEARSQSLQSMIMALERQIRDFEKKAAEFGKQADDAESRSFWQKLVKTISQVLTAVLPTQALFGAGASGSQIATGGAGTSNMLGNPNVSPQKLMEKNELESRIQGQQQTLDQRQGEVADLQTRLAASQIERERQTLEASLAQAQVDARKAQTELNTSKQQLEKMQQALETAASNRKTKELTLRQMQRKMLDAAANYEDVRCRQTDELRAISRLLAGKRTEHQQAELTVRCLNVGVAALKRCKEIALSIAYLYQSFAAFMELVISEAELQVQAYDHAASTPTIRSNSLKGLIRMSDHFLVTQAAEWLAVQSVSNTSAGVLSESWVKLNAMNSGHLAGEKLTAFLKQASAKLQQIADEREAHFKHRRELVNGYIDALDKGA
ncbi:hypothetical protein [Pseudomonas sp. PSKL.D1]|uniref:hypothetical protein n=1 Tax=Pseudomonas sp. PSKL.D1 TaxID=3029060 RepID=UPI0023814547|nr:hypothetical protein [Pseudomonas sp. PSKL.D1]WDY60232.1 hypothetical protein PVV54_11585 [Pseudomonas sp. PSKL.D1]